MAKRSTQLLSDVAMSLTGCRDLTEDGWWSGWKREHWPAPLLRKGFQFYGYDKEVRRLFGLVEVTRGGAFTYRTLDEFSKKVKEVAGYAPNRKASHWKKLPLPRRGQFCVGYAIQWHRVKKVDISWKGRFPQLGWARIPSGPPSPSLNADQSYIEGDPKYRRHLRIERNGKLRADARDFWRSRLKRLRCLACGFSFEKQYGTWGSEFVEMHHVIPLASIKKAHENNVRNLVPLCANCHRMVHLQPKSPLTMKELARMLAANHRFHIDARKSGTGG